MAYIEGNDRYQGSLIPRSLDEIIDENNPVRVIDAYVDSVVLNELGFKTYAGNSRGQRPYKREDLLKIILYCYMNKIRSSRGIEQETKRNIELMWLTGGINPDHGTISGFIKDNKEAIKELFKSYVLLLRGLALIDGQLVAIDGTKIKASNAKGKHFNQNKIKIKLEYYEKKIQEYLDSMEDMDRDSCEKLEEKFSKYASRIKRLKDIEKELKDEKKTQVCLTDPDAKSMRNNGGFEPCFNVQTAVDAKNKLIIAFDVVSDANDQAQLKNMVDRSKEILDITEGNADLSEEKRTFVLDTGYYNRHHIIESTDERTEILIKKRDKDAKKISPYDIEKFTYNPDNNTFTCPDGYDLVFKYKSKRKGHLVNKYECTGFAECKNRELCTKSKTKRGITISDSMNELKMIEKNTIAKNEVYKMRGQIVEHPFGTIKRHMGFTHFYRRGFGSVSSETGLILLTYNIKRTINVLGVKQMIALLKA